MTATPAETAAMERAFALATRGPLGLNPQVGAVLLSADGDVLAEGWHRGAGTAHAEVDALSHVQAATARGATIVVSLEPCNHTGRTRPCAQALIEAGVSRVVYSVSDPGAASSGGAHTLRDAGIDVAGGILAAEGAALIASWLDVQRLGRPHVTVKWAQSLDGRAAAADGTSAWITGPEARADVHARRAEADAIVAGVGTVLADDPALTAREADGRLRARQPVPVVLGRRAVPETAAVRRHPHAPLFFPGDDLVAMLGELRERGIQRVFVEGGPRVASAFFRAGLVDEVLAYVAPTLLGGPGTALGELGIATIAEAVRLVDVEYTPLGSDLLVRARIDQGGS